MKRLRDIPDFLYIVLQLEDLVRVEGMTEKRFSSFMKVSTVSNRVSQTGLAKLALAQFCGTSAMVSSIVSFAEFTSSLKEILLLKLFK